MHLFIRYLSVIIAMALLSSISPSGQAANKYGLGDVLNDCSLWPTFFPLGFRALIPGSFVTLVTNAEINIIYISADDVKGMDDYIDLYSVNGTTVWPEETWLLKGNATPVCTGASECQDHSATVGKGVSAYASLKSEFPNEKIKVAQQTIKSSNSSNSTWFFLPTRKFKLLRIEFFMPNNVKDGDYYSEPLYVEYRETGNRNELKRVSMGGTAAGADFNRVNLPEILHMPTTQGIEMWLVRANKNPTKPYSTLLPAAMAYPLTVSMNSIVPDNCK